MPHHVRRSAPMLFASLLAVAACRETRAPTAPQSRPAIRVETVSAVYSRGSSAMLDLVNDSTLTVGSNACAEGLEVLVGGDAWGRISPYEIGCIALYINVPPGGRARVVAPLPASLQPGTYRSYHMLGVGTTRVGHVRYSDPFLVR